MKADRSSSRRSLFWDFRPKRRKEERTNDPLAGLRFQEALPSDREVSDAEIDRQVARLQTKLRQRRDQTARSHSLRPWLPRVAAVLAGIMVVGSALFWLLHAQTVRVETAFGETKVFWLPDSSRVTLNAHSSLTYTADWEEGTTREVHLEGEAFFSVRKQQTATGRVKFVVHTEDVHVEVLGTEFNVRQRRDQTQVMLEEGSVRLRVKEHPHEILMQPGDLVEVLPRTHEVQQRIVNPERYSSWKQHQWILNNTSLQEIAGRIEELYGLPVRLPDSATAHLQLTGTFPTGELTKLLDVLSASTGLQVEQQKDQILLH
ncbi:ferric-dicitrate binding protein FerR, regulates iron transport through sigma-19 [Catalinimonas alkaloidigena]|uniref:Ferric-dicitrate binding protein FerR, regulates iron transport through sigma-19 n=1 Tax=Catalinimonas alkaloidigena TaxID=1075417 RepID=A0A1G9KZ08_9BACT|nr:FecR domain-containing protein [Catalinimonas alkaloidigena]SDL54743.1 ferric-dicitrate binding protein FerR, regulates iron transport through sigma-19 [Catalinimonas alkaloidigena]